MVDGGIDFRMRVHGSVLGEGATPAFIRGGNIRKMQMGEKIVKTSL